MNASHLFGITVVVSEDRPKMQLSADCPVTPDFREEMNRWMAEFFGFWNLIEDGRVLMDGPNARAYMNPRTYASMRHSLRAAGIA